MKKALIQRVRALVARGPGARGLGGFQSRVQIIVRVI